MNLIIRATQVISFNKFLEIEVADFSSIRIKHPTRPSSGRPIDIGAIVYCRREWNNQISSKKRNFPTLVDPSSFRKERLAFIQSLPSELFKLRGETINTYLKSFIKVFDWTDQNGFEAFLTNEEVAFNAYVTYTKWLESRVKNTTYDESFTPRTAKDKQWYFRRIIEIGFPSKFQNIISSVIVLTGKSESKPNIDFESVKYYYEVNAEVFRKFSQQCFDNKKYPPFLNTPDFSSYFINIVCKYAYLKSPFCQKVLSPFFDYKSGYISERYNHVINNPRSPSRIYLAFRAMNAFVEVFRILTCCNRSTLRHLEFDSSMHSNRDFMSNEFISVKYRANNREVTFRLHKNGFKLYLRFLELREWILNGQKSQFLFFTLGRNSKGKPEQLKKQHSDNHHNALKKAGIIDSKTLLPSDTELRSLNTTFLLNRGYSTKQVAERNNHSLRVAEQIYNNPPDSQIRYEIDSYYNSMKIASAQFHDIKHTTVSGSCTSSIQSSESIIETSIFESSCKEAFGCLFCKYFACQTNEIDIRKLMSMKFIAFEVKAKSIDIDHADEIYDPIINRIDTIFKQLETKQPNIKALITRIENEVFNMCELTPFWFNRLQYYNELGVIKL